MSLDRNKELFNRLSKSAFPPVENPHVSYEEMAAYVDGTADPITKEIVEGLIEIDPGFAASIESMQDAKAELALTGVRSFAPPQRRSILAALFSGNARYATLGVQAFDFSDDIQAERLYRSAVADHPDLVEPAFNLASFLHNVKHDVDEAEDLYRKAIQIEPTCVPAYKGLAELLYQSRHEVDDAATLYRKAVEIAPDDSGAINNLGAILMDEKADFGEAERLYRRAVQLDPNNGVFHANLAGVYFEQGKEREASAEAMRAISLGCPDHWVFGLV